MPTSGADNVVYVIAAYTITLCALALYGVLLQHRVRAYSTLADSATTGPAADIARGFNLGAAVLSPFWMWRHGMRLPGAALLLVWLAVPLLFERALWVPLGFVAIVSLGAGAVLGFLGNRIASAHHRFEDRAELSSDQLPWAAAGVVLYAFALPWVWYFNATTG